MKKSAVWSIVIVIAILGLFVIADISARSIAASIVEDKLSEKGNVTSPEVNFEGFPFLLQVARNNYSKVRITSPHIVTSFNDTEVELKGIHAVASHVSRVDNVITMYKVDADFRIPVKSIDDIVKSTSPVDLDISVKDGQFTASRSVMKVPIYASFDTTIARNEADEITLELTPSKVWAGMKGLSDYGVEEGLDMIPAVSIPFHAFPTDADIDITHIDGTGISLNVKAQRLTMNSEGVVVDAPLCGS